jgi:hypothetical protein
MSEQHENGSGESRPLRRDVATRFKPGNRFAVGKGRPLGSPNKSTIIIRDFSRKLFGGLFKDPKYLAALRDRILRGKEHPAIVALLLGYGYGKPPDKLIIDDERTDGGGTERRDELIERLCDRFAKLATEKKDPPGSQPIVVNGSGDVVVELETLGQAEPTASSGTVDGVGGDCGARVRKDKNGG